jgi:hypothetical protein
MNETTQNLLDVFASLEPWHPPVVFWRLYYNEAGVPLFYTQEDKPGNYIDVTPEQYQRASMQVKVVDRKLVELTTKRTRKLMPSETGTPCYPSDVSIVVPETDQHQRWRIKTNETN